MVKVALQGAEFFAYHGFYPEEQLLGTRFVVDIEVVFDSVADFNDDKIANTVNYEELYQIAKTEMQHTRKLIETVAQGIIDGIAAKYAYVQVASVTIKKAHPPLGGTVQNSVVSISFNKKK
ncbi:dihydroneopterin aldolase [Mucilaginibacter pedocola]|uniref:7,8-dihydroneopterin aldolase n=1 Tax=Mucilaginibacter pedocola TaxID=1792845 RepID=A0A1S9PL14_9SPHI|nr:dihydroneopterin aldolase [Mucilaginibacter pedocola]OOQ61641.1 dihydroneopterin aldolase [Mucilaginibacter pedocola]